MHSFNPQIICRYTFPTVRWIIISSAQVSTEVDYFRNQNTATFPEDHCCAIICCLRGIRSSITLSNHRSVPGGRFWVSFCIFGQACSPSPPTDMPRPPPASPLVGIDFSEGDCCLSTKNRHQHKHKLQTSYVLHPSPSSNGPVRVVEHIHSVPPHHHREYIPNEIIPSMLIVVSRSFS